MNALQEVSAGRVAAGRCRPAAAPGRSLTLGPWTGRGSVRPPGPGAEIRGGGGGVGLRMSKTKNKKTLQEAKLARLWESSLCFCLREVWGIFVRASFRIFE